MAEAPAASENAAASTDPTAPLPPTPLVHLHVHSEYSLLDGAIRIPDLVKRVKELGQKAVALTDHGNLFGAIEFYTKAKSAGIKPILGCEIFHHGSDATVAALKAVGAPPAAGHAFHLVLLARDNAGWKNLIRLVSAGYLEGPGGDIPIVPEATLSLRAEGQIALSACLRGELAGLTRELRRLSPGRELALDAPADDPAHALVAALAAHVAAMHARFGVGFYFVEITNNNIPDQRALIPDLVAVARHFGLPLVATADAHYLKREESESHAVLMGIKHSLTMSKIRGRRKGTRFHVFDDAEMRSVYGAWPEALENTHKIADLCHIDLKFGQYFLPRFETGTDESADQSMARLAREMLEERFTTLRRVYGASFDAAREQFYRDRLEYEITVINNMGFAGYFLIVQDFINWAKRQDIPVGPGRGSGAGSIVAYALRITDIDPIPYNLLFERFLNPERVSMPDFDVDFCQDRRDEVIKYVAEHYGQENVAQITTFGKMNAKAAIRDVGRVLELGYTRVDRIAKLIPDEIGITLDEAIAKEPRITEEANRDETVAELLRLARSLEGLARHCSVHAAGIVISDGPVVQYVPVYKVPGENGLITQFEMKMAEKVGLVKFDFLGLKTLTVIQKAIELIRAKKKPEFDLALIPLDDKRVYRDISAGHSVGVFQLESTGMRQLIIKLKPSCFEDMIALVALFRPGPLGSGMVDDFIERKHGRQAIIYPVPQLESILKETYGVILYQEQVMKTAGELASYSLGEADLLRRAMGKKIAEEMAKQKTRFMEGAVKNGHPDEKAGEIFDLMAEFANYGFNKSHSAAYGLVSYQTAYLKSHYTDEFMAAIMTCDLGDTKKIVRYVDECRRLRITLLPPDINRSILSFDVPKPGTIGFGLAALKGIGAGSIEGLVKERQARGPFKDLSDLARRLNLHTIGKKTLELLTQAGALDGFGMSRPKLFSVLGDVVKYSESLHAAKAGGQRGLFDMDDEADAPADGRTDGLSWPLTAADRRPGAPDPAWLKKEKALLGVFLTGHPLKFHREDVRCFGRGVKTSELEKHLGKKSVQLVGVLAFANERITKSGKRMGSLRIEDEHGAIEAIMFEKEMPKEFPDPGTLVVAVGSVDKAFDGDGIRYRLDKVTPLEELRQEHVERVTLRVRPVGGLAAKKADYADAIEQLKKLVVTHAGDTPLKIVVDYGETEVELGGSLAVDLLDPFLHGLGPLAFERLELTYALYATSASAAPSATAPLGQAPVMDPSAMLGAEAAMGSAVGFSAGDEIPLPSHPDA